MEPYPSRAEPRLRKDLPLAQPRLAGAHRLAVGRAADVGGALHQGDLGRVLEQAQLVQDRRRVQDLRGAPGALALLGAERVQQRDDAGVDLREEAQRVHERRAPADRRLEGLVQLLVGARLVGAEHLDGALHTGPPAVPDLTLRVARRHDQLEGRAVAPLSQDRQRFRFAEARQVHQVRVLSVAMIHVPVAARDRGGGQDRDRSLGHPSQKALAPRCERRALLRAEPL